MALDPLSRSPLLILGCQEHVFTHLILTKPNVAGTEMIPI